MESSAHVCRACREGAELFYRKDADVFFACLRHAEPSREWLDVHAMGGALLAATMAAARFTARAP